MPQKISTSKLPKLHLIQWGILRKLGRSAGLRYNDLKPIEMDPHRFTYHMKKLLLLDLIDERDRVYVLTQKGKLLLNYFNKIPLFKDLPVDSFILLYIKRGKDLLVVERQIAPYLGYIGTPSFAILNNRYVDEVARKALSKLGLKGALSLNLILDILYKSQREVIKHTLIYTFYCSEPKGEAVKRNEEGRLLWMKPSELLNAKKGFDNSRDLIKFFEGRRKSSPGIALISRTYNTPM